MANYCICILLLYDWQGGWMGGWMDGWVGGKAGLKIAYSNQKQEQV